MTRFENGPAAGQILQLRCAPLFLRVVEKNGVWDALDLPGDGPQPEETIYCYQRKGEPGMAFVDGSGPKGRWGMRLAIAEYVMCTNAPTDEVMRDNDKWKQWCDEGKSMAKQEFDVVGGKSDGKKYTSYQPKPPIWMTLDEQRYIALRFARDPKDGSKGEVTIYMLENTKPSDAMAVWRSRQSGGGKRPDKSGSEEGKDGLNTGIVQPDNPPPPTPNEPPPPNLTEHEQKAVEMARKFVAATTTKDHEAFCEMGEKLLEELGKIRTIFVGRGRLMIELATKVADVKAHPDKYKPSNKPAPENSQNIPATPTKGKTANVREEINKTRRIVTPEENAKTMGALPVPTDPDDEPW